MALGLLGSINVRADLRANLGKNRGRISPKQVIRLAQLPRITDVVSFAGQGRDGGVRETTGTGGVVHRAVRAHLDRAHAQRIIAITDQGDRGLIALKACQAYVREVIR